MHVKKKLYSPNSPENREKSRNTRNPCTRPIHILKYILVLFLERERGEEREVRFRERKSRERKSDF